MNQIYLLNKTIDDFSRRDELRALTLFNNGKGCYFDLDNPDVKELHCELFADRKPMLPVTALPRDQWPVWTSLIEAMKAEPDIGIGDTIERCAGASGRKFRAMFKFITGNDCGCGARRDRFNGLYPYTSA